MTIQAPNLGDPPTTDCTYVDFFQLVSNNDWSKGITFGVGKLWVLEYDRVNNVVGTDDSDYPPECMKKSIQPDIVPYLLAYLLTYVCRKI